jgi:hypothetical protein
VSTIKNIDLPRSYSLELNNKNLEDNIENLDTDQLINKNNKSKTLHSRPLMCTVDECVFKIPANYRCTNNYYPSGIETNLNDQSMKRNKNIAGATNYENRNHFSQLDEDDIQIQLAIQQSIALMNGNSEPTNEMTQFVAEGPTNLEEYHRRKNNRILTHTEDDLILQRYYYF